MQRQQTKSITQISLPRRSANSKLALSTKGLKSTLSHSHLRITEHTIHIVRSPNSTVLKNGYCVYIYVVFGFGNHPNGSSKFYFISLFHVPFGFCFYFSCSCHSLLDQIYSGEFRVKASGGLIDQDVQLRISLRLQYPLQCTQ